MDGTPQYLVNRQEKLRKTLRGPLMHYRKPKPHELYHIGAKPIPRGAFRFAFPPLRGRKMAWWKSRVPRTNIPTL